MKLLTIRSIIIILLTAKTSNAQDNEMYYRNDTIINIITVNKTLKFYEYNIVENDTVLRDIILYPSVELLNNHITVYTYADKAVVEAYKEGIFKQMIYQGVIVLKSKDDDSEALYTVYLETGKWDYVSKREIMHYIMTGKVQYDDYLIFNKK